MEPNKSSINFLLADSKEAGDPTPPVASDTQPPQPPMPVPMDQDEEDEVVVVVPRTASGSKQKKRHIRRPKNPRIALEIIQQPKNAKVSTRASGRVFPPFSEHRPIHPPPVLQLKVEDFKPKHEGALTDDLIGSIKKSQGNKSSERLQELEVIKKMRENRIPPWVHYSTFFVTARLRCSPSQSEKLLFHNSNNSNNNNNNNSSGGNNSSQSVDDLLIGTNVASGMPLSLRINSSSTGKQLNHLLPIEKHRANNYGIVFVFPDLSVRKVGIFKLKFDLFEVSKGKVYWRNEIFSDDIQIYTPKKFPGSTPSSPLTSFLYRRGARIRQRKRTATKRSHDDAEDEEEEEENDRSSGSPATKAESRHGNFTQSSSHNKHQKPQPPQPLNIIPMYSSSTTPSSSSTPYQQHQPYNMQPMHQIPSMYPHHYQQQHPHPQYIPYPPPQAHIVHHPHYQQSPALMYAQQQPTSYPFQLPPPGQARSYPYQPMMLAQPVAYSTHQQHTQMTPQLQPLQPHHQSQMSPSVHVSLPQSSTDDTRAEKR